MEPEPEQHGSRQPLRRERRRVKRKKRAASLDFIRPPSEVRLSVGGDCAGMRLDAFLAARLPWRSRESVQQMLRESRVLVDRARRKQSYRLKGGQEIVVLLAPPPEEAFRIGEIPLHFVYEDDTIFALNKQPRIVVHPAGSVRFGSILNALHLRYRRPDDPERDVVPHLAHRLDKDTSGLLLGCKTRAARKAIGLQFQRSQVGKEYLAIVEGVVRDDAGEVDLPMGRLHPRSLRHCVQTDGGSPATTRYEVLERFHGFSLVVARPVTGRQHQIRVHLQEIGHPIACDKLYGIRKRLMKGDLAPLAPGQEDAPLLTRQALHCHRVSFLHPTLGQVMALRAPLWEDMAAALEALRAASRS